MIDTVREGLLYTLYGFLLTEKQKRIFEAYHFDDLSLSEIAENLNISKQAVSDQLNRSSDKLDMVEKELKLLQKIQLYHSYLHSMEEVCRQSDIDRTHLLEYIEKMKSLFEIV